MDAYEFIDVEAALVQDLKGRGFTASTMVPNPAPVEHVLVDRVGGVADVVTDNATVTFIVSAGSWPAAFALTKRVRQRVLSVPVLGGMPVYRRREVGGPSRAPDPDTGGARYQFTVEVKVRGSEPTP